MQQIGAGHCQVDRAPQVALAGDRVAAIVEFPAQPLQQGGLEVAVVDALVEPEGHLRLLRDAQVGERHVAALGGRGTAPPARSGTAACGRDSG
ncbi:hypothetical protein ABMY26_33600 [Azospirillum sp. HJ39]|uniref:hypothetical protein n=1 Tax=Azospirillum sp. HJ39 TaxID=3159496 RepID=UPI003558F64A